MSCCAIAEAGFDDTALDFGADTAKAAIIAVESDPDFGSATEGADACPSREFSVSVALIETRLAVRYVREAGGEVVVLDDSMAEISTLGASVRPFDKSTAPLFLL
jgi:hypothetical protein